MPVKSTTTETFCEVIMSGEIAQGAPITTSSTCPQLSTFLETRAMGEEGTVSRRNGSNCERL